MNSDNRTETFRLLKFILERKKVNSIVLVITTVGFLIVVFFVIPKEYTAEISVLPSASASSKGLGGQLGNLASLAGISMGSLSSRSQEMYLGIINSRKLLERVIFHEYELKKRGEIKKTNLIEFFELNEDEDASQEERIQKALKKLRDDVIVTNIDDDNEILYLSITTEDANLSAMVANLMVEILDELVLTKVQKEITDQNEYLNQRLVQIKDSISIGEQELKTLLEKSSDPTLPAFQVAQIRARRKLEIQTAVYVELRKQKEILYIENFVNLSPIKVLDKAYPPYRKSRPKRLFVLITFMALAGFVQIGVNWVIYLYPRFSLE
jgi:uncharacterized protein involved in exopolysaccharide biosynthesis